MERLVLVLVVVFGLSGCITNYIPPSQIEIQNSRVINKSFADIWELTIGWFAKNGTPIKTLDKNSGFIATEPNLKCSISEYMDCGIGGSQTDGLASFNITIVQSGGGYKVTVNMFPTCFLSYMGWDKGSNSRQDCVSNGRLERVVLDYIETGVFKTVIQKD